MQAINHWGCDGSWLQATSMADPRAPLAKGNRQGTGCWRRCHYTQSVCNAAAWIYIKQGQRLDDLIFSFFLAVQQEIAGILTYLARWPRNWGPRNTEDLAWPRASVLHTEPAGTWGWGVCTADQGMGGHSKDPHTGQGFRNWWRVTSMAWMA